MSTSRGCGVPCFRTGLLGPERAAGGVLLVGRGFRDTDGCSGALAAPQECSTERLDRIGSCLYIVHRQHTMDQRAPVLKIDLASSEAAYEQITSGLRTLLVAGQFRPGSQLPTVRELA